MFFLSNWYSSQELKVHWGSCLSELFCVSNGVRQGGVFSPVLFTVYLVVCWMNCRILVLVVIEVLCLFVLFVMLMILFSWLNVPLLLDLCLISAIHMQNHMVKCLMKVKLN